MAEDREVLREIWVGSLPVSFTLASDELETMHQPDPYYLMVPRVSYFPLVIDKVLKHFSRFIAESKQNATDMWLDFEDQPLKWHYPIGLLWDLYGADSSLPWNVTVHFSKFPEDELVRCITRSAVESMFISTVKEADVLKHRGAVMDSMQKKDHNQLWLGLQNDRFDQFWSVNRRLMENSVEKPFLNIPLRLYQPSTLGYSQMLVKSTRKDSNEALTLGDLLKDINLEPPETVQQQSKDPLEPHIVLHGVEPPLATPIQWLSEHLSYPDNFLHLCVHWRPVTSPLSSPSQAKIPEQSQAEVVQEP